MNTFLYTYSIAFFVIRFCLFFWFYLMDNKLLRELIIWELVTSGPAVAVFLILSN